MGHTRSSLRGPAAGSGQSWLGALRRYFLFAGPANLLWEILQLPLYTIWREGTPGEITFAVLHCTGGDVLIAFACLTAALILVGGASWPAGRFGAVTTVTVALGLVYTLHSEWLNVVARGTWAYSSLMPVLPPLGTGLSPVLQWLILPSLGLSWARSSTASTSEPSGALA